MQVERVQELGRALDVRLAVLVALEARDVPQDDRREVAHVRHLARRQHRAVRADRHRGDAVRVRLQEDLVAVVVHVADDDARAERVDDVLLRHRVQQEAALDRAAEADAGAERGAVQPFSAECNGFLYLGIRRSCGIPRVRSTEQS